MLSVSDERILEYVWDYKINLIDPYRMSKEDFSKFRTELGLILEITKYSRTWKDLSRMKDEDRRLEDVSLEGVRLLRETIGLKLPKGQKPNSRGGYNVCGALEEMQAIFEQSGEQRGRQSGEREAYLKLVRKRMEGRGMTAREAAEDLGLEPEEADWCVEAISSGGDARS